MAKFAGKYRIESNRWKYWDYSMPAHYFITICTAARQCIFGDIVNGKMQLSVSGEMVADEIKRLPRYHKRCLLDEWVVMPNHVHLIVTLEEFDFDNGISKIGDTNILVETIHELSLRERPIPQTEEEIEEYRKQRRLMLIPKIIGKMKMLVSSQINIHKKTIDEQNWQANYHDHVIRTEKSYWNIKNYIRNNPGNWEDDKFYDG